MYRLDWETFHKSWHYLSKVVFNNNDDDDDDDAWTIY